MPLATAATGIGKQVVTHVWCTWSGAKRERAARDAELIDLVRLSVRDHFQQRKWVRQLEDLADHVAERLRPVYEHEFRDVLENERTAALLTVVDALAATDLTDDTLFAVDVNVRKLARLVRQRVPVRRGRSDRPEARWFTDGHWFTEGRRTAPGSSRFSGPLADWNGCVPFLVRLRSYANRPLPGPEQLLTGITSYFPLNDGPPQGPLRGDRVHD